MCYPGNHAGLGQPYSPDVTTCIKPSCRAAACHARAHVLHTAGVLQYAHARMHPTDRLPDDRDSHRADKSKRRRRRHIIARQLRTNEQVQLLHGPGMETVFGQSFDVRLEPVWPLGAERKKKYR